MPSRSFFLLKCLQLTDIKQGNDSVCQNVAKSSNNLAIINFTKMYCIGNNDKRRFQLNAANISLPLAVILQTPYLILHPASRSTVASVGLKYCLCNSLLSASAQYSMVVADYLAHISHRVILIVSFNHLCPAVCRVLISSHSPFLSYHLFLQQSLLPRSCYLV